VVENLPYLFFYFLETFSNSIRITIKKQTIMSYSIIYNKQFIRVGDNQFIPMIEGGDNNCYEAYGSGKKRARSWYNHTYLLNGKQYGTAEEILSNIDKLREDRIEWSKKYIEQHGDEETWKYSDDNFGSHEGITFYGKKTTSVTFSQFKSFYKTGIKQALTIEELKEFGVEVGIHLYYWKEEDITSKGLEIKPRINFESTQHLIDTIKEWEDYYGNKASFYLHFDNDWALERIVKKRNEARKKNRKTKEIREVQEYYVLENNNGYFVRNTARGYKYSYYISSSTKKFLTEKEAVKFHEKMRNKDLFKIKKITSPTRIYA
jgi:hypothetical protein